MSKLGMILQVKMNLKGVVAITLHTCHTSALWPKVKTSIPSSIDECDSNDEGKPSIDELAHVVFFKDVCTKQKAQLKVLKSKLFSS
jgi:hypothetical protein